LNFISYRREDTGSAAGRVYDRLARLLPKSNLFFDVNTIGGGEDFVRRIESEIGRSDVALVFIGDKWLEPAHPPGSGRIWEQDDFVRAELRAALGRPMLILPILVAGARMPKPEQLPEDVRAVTGRNALPLRHESFDGDTEASWRRCWRCLEGPCGKTRAHLGQRSATGSAAQSRLLHSCSSLPSCIFGCSRVRFPPLSVGHSRHCC
jgi:hypothetical protein